MSQMDRPDTIGNAKVICYAHIQAKPDAAVVGLAICRHTNDQAFYLFGCNSAWHSISDTWHKTLTEAKKQAEFEHGSTSIVWKQKP